MTDLNVAVILPSRGLMFSRTAEEILANVKDVPHRFFFAHKLPIPECFEKPVTEALKGSYSHLWLVEDDMILPPDTLKRMLDMDKAVVTANYPTTGKGDAAVLSVKGRVVYGGTGCTLVKREVFDELKTPYFRSDIAWIPKNKGDHIRFTAIEKGDSGAYGLHDVNFFMNLYRLEIPVHVLPGTLGQRKLKALGQAGSNNGAHKVEEWKKAKKDRYFTLMKNLPVEKQGTMTSVIVNGKELTCTADHANNLVKKGLGIKPPHRPVVVDWGGV